MMKRNHLFGEEVRLTYKKDGAPKNSKKLFPPGISKAFRERFERSFRVVKAGSRWRPLDGAGKVGPKFNEAPLTLFNREIQGETRRRGQKLGIAHLNNQMSETHCEYITSILWDRSSIGNDSVTGKSIPTRSRIVPKPKRNVARR